MIFARWKKVLTDLSANKMRTILVVLSIAVGVFAVGLVASTFAIVKHDMTADYLAVNAHTVKIFVAAFDEDLVETLAKAPGVEAIEGRYNLWIKAIGRDGNKVEINIDSIAPLDELQVDQLVFEAGSRQLGNNEIFLERQGAAGLGLQPGDEVELVLVNGRVRRLRVAGTVHDVNANPYKFTSKTSGYVTPQTMEHLGGSQLYNYLAIVTAGSHTDAAQVRAVAEGVADEIRRQGLEVQNINIVNPGQHPAQSIIDTVLTLLSALSGLAVFLSAFLVTNTISALMSQQIRQIGVMKALGATVGQMLVLYLVLVLTFGILALIVAVPLSALAASILSRWLIGMLNATPSPFALSTQALSLQVLIGLAAPVLAALVPIFKGTRLTVRAALGSYGLSANNRSRLFDRVIESVRCLPRPLLLSLRNTFRRKGRLVLTLSTLILGGAIFIAVVSVRKSMHLEIDLSHGFFQSDVNADFPRPLRFQKVKEMIQDVPGITAIEGWQLLRANALHPDGENDDLIAITAPPANTRLLNPVLITGRWLLPSDENGIVLDNHFQNLRPDVRVGDHITVRINARDYDFVVLGFVKLATNTGVPYSYVNYEYMSRITGNVGQINSLRVVTDRHDLARQNEVLAALEKRFAQKGLPVTLQTGQAMIAQSQSQVNILIYLLLLMAVLIAVVGGLGLMGTIGMNVLERTREIGVLRAIGADNAAIFGIILSEGLLIGLISWLFSIVVSIPIAQLLDNRLGAQLMTVPLGYSTSYQGILIWLGAVLLISTAACLAPARNAIRLTVRDVLAYE